MQKLFSAQSSLYLVGAMFCLPFMIAYHDIPIPNFYSEWMAAFIGLAALLPLIAKPLWQTPVLPRSSAIFLLLLLITSLQDIFGPQPASPNIGLIQGYIAWAFLITTLGYHLRQKLGWESICLTLANSVLIACAINGGFVILQFMQQFGFNLPIPQLQSYGMLGQSNHFADFVSLGIVSLFYAYAKQGMRKRTLALSLLMGLVMLALSGSRSSMLYLSMIALSFGLLNQVFKRQQKDTAITAHLFKLSLGLLPAFLLLQLVLTIFFPEAMIHTPVKRAMEALSQPSASLRWQFWQTSITLFSQQPLLGIGAGQMRWQTLLLADNPAANPAHIFFEHAHNLFLNLLAEMGVFALLIVVGALYLWLRGFLKSFRGSFETWWLLASLGVIGLHSMLEYPLWYSYFLGIFAFLLGAGESSAIALTRLSQSAQNLLRLSLVAIILYGFVQLSLMQLAYQKLETNISNASQAEMTDNQKQSLVNDMLWINANTLLGPYSNLVLATYLVPNISQSEIQLALAENAVRFIPLRQPYLNFIILLELRNEHTQAIQHLNRLLQISHGDLRQDLQQLPYENAKVLQRLLDEIQQNKPMQ